MRACDRPFLRCARMAAIINDRLYRRKGNVGEAAVTDCEVTARYRLSADEASNMWGGLDILSIDCGE